MLRAAFFDLDGTLTDTVPIHYRAWCEAVGRYGGTLKKEEYETLTRLPAEHIAQRIVSLNNLSLDPLVLLREKRSLLLSVVETYGAPLKPYARDAVLFFVTRNIPCVCVTSSPRNEAVVKLRRADLLPFFTHVVTLDEVTRGKPHPDLYNEALARVNVPPSSCIAFEDTGEGVDAATAAGVPVIAIPHDFSRTHDFSRAYACCSHLADALSIVARDFLP